MFILFWINYSCYLLVSVYWWFDYNKFIFCIDVSFMLIIYLRYLVKYNYDYDKIKYKMLKKYIKKLIWELVK